MQPSPRMEKVFIKPVAREILIKDSLKDGYFDVYSYDYHADDQKRKLGSLYIVGNVNHQSAENTSNTETILSSESQDVAYMINLVASLAKREYYSKPNLLPKEAFTATLKKINEVVEEFFKNKETKINIGIFAVAGEEIHVSRLGKFKIILSRDNQTIDILNNITLFDKEHVEEKEFSNIISGKIKNGDKLLAFYPSRFITSREKTIKDHFIKLDWGKFLEKINDIKGNKTDVACAALYIDINKVKEMAMVSKPQPQELKPKYKQITTEEAQLASADEQTPSQVSTAIEPMKPELPQANVHEKDTLNTPSAQEPEIPNIIPTEFSSSRKENIFEKIISKIKSFRKESPYGRISRPSFAYKRQAAIIVPIVVAVAVGGWFAKNYIFVSADIKAERKIAKQLKENIKLAQDKIANNDTLTARQLLLGSLLNSTSSDTNQELTNLLDKADEAIQANPVLVDKLPDDVAKKAQVLDLEEENIKSGKYNMPSPVLSIDIYENNLYALVGNKIFKVVDSVKGSLTTVQWLKEGVTVPDNSSLLVVDGNVYIFGKNGIITKYYRGEKIKEFNTSITADDSVLLTAKDIPGLYLINKKLGRIYVIDKESGSIIKVVKIGNTDSLIAVYLDNQGIVYLTTQDNKIWRIE